MIKEIDSIGNVALKDNGTMYILDVNGKSYMINKDHVPKNFSDMKKSYTGIEQNVSSQNISTDDIDTLLGRIQ